MYKKNILRIRNFTNTLPTQNLCYFLNIMEPLWPSGLNASMTFSKLVWEITFEIPPNLDCREKAVNVDISYHFAKSYCVLHKNKPFSKI